MNLSHDMVMFAHYPGGDMFSRPLIHTGGGAVAPLSVAAGTNPDLPPLNAETVRAVWQFWLSVALSSRETTGRLEPSAPATLTESCLGREEDSATVRCCRWRQLFLGGGNSNLCLIEWPMGWPSAFRGSRNQCPE